MILYSQSTVIIIITLIIITILTVILSLNNNNCNNNNIFPYWRLYYRFLMPKLFIKLQLIFWATLKPPHFQHCPPMADPTAISVLCQSQLRIFGHFLRFNLFFVTWSSFSLHDQAPGFLSPLPLCEISFKSLHRLKWPRWQAPSSRGRREWDLTSVREGNRRRFTAMGPRFTESSHTLLVWVLTGVSPYHWQSWKLEVLNDSSLST